LASASIRKFCGQAALTAVIVFGGLVMGAVKIDLIRIQSTKERETGFYRH